MKRSAKKDKGKWLSDLASAGDWKSVRKLRQLTRSSQTRLLNSSGQIVSTDERAQTFADHLESVQWHVRPITLIPGELPPIHSPLDANTENFTHKELRRAIMSLASGKSFKKDDVGIECFKALALEAGAALQEFLDLCNICLHHCTFPKDWLVARIVMIFKKGDPAACDNYRPISLLSVSWKIFGSMLRNRLAEAGIDGLLWPSQYGFRTGRSTRDAMFIARRLIETTRAQRFGRVSLLALDWKKAFDSVHLDSLNDALGRFGIPDAYLQLISAYMRNREFYVEEFGVESERRPQRSGVSQGCTLSPLLFLIVMSVLMKDAVSLLQADARAAYERGDLADLAYADDTLLIGTQSKHVSEFLAAVEKAGARLGLQLHHGKFQLLQVGCNDAVYLPGGQRQAATASQVYLGTTLTESGCAHSELGRRMGIARAELRTLSKVWNHARITRGRKVEIYRSPDRIETSVWTGLCQLDGSPAEATQRLSIKMSTNMLGHKARIHIQSVQRNCLGAGGPHAGNPVTRETATLLAWQSSSVTTRQSVALSLLGARHDDTQDCTICSESWAPMPRMVYICYDKGLPTDVQDPFRDGTDSTEPHILETPLSITTVLVFYSWPFWRRSAGVVILYRGRAF